MDALLTESDIVSLHCPLKKENTGFMNAALISKMKRTAFLINTARGQLVNEQDLADALNRGIIAGAGIDVVSKEPPSDGNPLFSAINCFISPHIAWATLSARTRLMKIAEENLRSFIEGKQRNIINADYLAR
jgi:glycerate dehydrogenase